MGKLNVFEGKLEYEPGSENRLTWAFMNLIRLSPIVCAAFLDLVREKQEKPISGFTTLRERERFVHTQVGTLTADGGRLVAIGITGEGRDVDAQIQPEDRSAIYDGVVTFIAPEGRRHEQESLTLTIESKIGPEVGAWQLQPSKESMGEEQQFEVDPEPVTLAWREILRVLTDLELRGLINPTEKVLIRDFVDYVDTHHPKLNPFDHFSVCRNNLHLLNRRCEAILRKIDPNEAWHRSWPIIGVKKAHAFKQVWLKAEEHEHGSTWQIRLELWPGDNMQQARNFWKKVDTDKLLALQQKDWRILRNLHFSYAGTHLAWATTTLTVSDYIKYWKSNHEEKIISFYPDVGSFRHNWEQLIADGLISQADVTPLEEVSTQTKRDYISMSPGLGVCYTWPEKLASQFDLNGDFIKEVKQRIREATETWGEVPGFCQEG